MLTTSYYYNMTNRKVTLFIKAHIWAILCSLFVHSIKIDLLDDNFPPNVNAYHGSFQEGGLYRLIQCIDVDLDAVVYGNLLIAKVPQGSARDMYVYIEEYKIQSKVIICITFIDMILEICKSRRYYRYKIFGFAEASHQIMKSVKDPIFLEIDMTMEKMHHQLRCELRPEGEHGAPWYSVRPQYIIGKDNRFRCRRFASRFLISQILNVDYRNNGIYPPSSLIGYFKGFSRSCSEEHCIVTVLDQYEFMYEIVIPPTINGIFRPRNIYETMVEIDPHMQRRLSPDKTLIEIDISSIKQNRDDLVILANLKRGKWLYTQYTIIPYRYPLYEIACVISTEDISTIYCPTGQTVVTHVEVFDHIIHKWRYIVIHTVKFNEGNDMNDYDIYKRIDDEEGVKYFDVGNNFCKEPYMLMLNNISTEEGGDEGLHTACMGQVLNVTTSA
ncbi:hypothetical protein BBOV_III011310 [Babesia bovis T2Bo]|uniref:Uncharacterized protein n=1 Tax=Babesia bovis TaxID=5865 RepID=A7AQ49_BABBO|nr:hypothetical protein BBOV_III011310 [Babesia bovis T2Bo]EDO08683.1 hypothetical protein BBOV_III011310 [Babesia bovis T2Bo]|eukprot:XP_001612251.1 hypothetical protein [Babesia bovis T2Bo]